MQKQNSKKTKQLHIIEAHRELFQQHPELLSEFSSLERLHVPKRTRLMSPGDPDKGFWFIEQGLARSFSYTADLSEHNRTFYAEGHWIGSNLGLTDHLSIGFESLEPCLLVYLPLDTFNQWVVQYPGVAALKIQSVMKVLERKLSRETELLTLDAEQLYIRFLKEFADIAERIPLKEVAAYLGITNVALSRIRRRIQKSSELEA